MSLERDMAYDGSESMNVLGEKAFLASLLPTLTAPETLIDGYGHDAAVIRVDGLSVDLVHKIDRASMPVALTAGWSDHKTWGRMAVTANCSDILAVGGTPVASMVAVMAPGTTSADKLRSVIHGAAEECSLNRIVYAGGDVKESATFEVVGSAIGLVPRGRSLPRTAGQPGDLVVCAGTVGGFAAACVLLREAKRRPILAPYLQQCIDYISFPKAQWNEARAMNQIGVAHSAMDASDGLFEVFKTLAGEEAKMTIDFRRPQYHPLALLCEKLVGLPRQRLIFGAGDWNIVYCIPARFETLIDKVGASAGMSLRIIGRLSRGNGVFGVSDSRFREERVNAPIHEHFKHRIEQSGDFFDVLWGGQKR